jgi:hypothetical protein
MANQFSNDETTRTETIRYKWKDTSAVLQMRCLPDNDILIRTAPTDVDSVNKMMTDMGFSIVPREYVVHVSTLSKKVFDTYFKDVPHEVRESATRYIAKIVVPSKEQYDTYLELNSQECRVKPFRERFFTARTDNQSDTAEHTNHYQGKGYQSRDQSRGGEHDNRQAEDTRGTGGSRGYQSNRGYQGGGGGGGGQPYHGGGGGGQPYHGGGGGGGRGQPYQGKGNRGRGGQQYQGGERRTNTTTTAANTNM